MCPNVSEDFLEWTRKFRERGTYDNPDMFSDEYTANRKSYFLKINYRVWYKIIMEEDFTSTSIFLILLRLSKFSPISR